MIFNILFSLNWLPGFSVCSIAQIYLEKLNIPHKKANIITCILLQIYFVYNAGYMLYSELILKTPSSDLVRLTLQNIEMLYGYFIFDLIYLFKAEKPSVIFICHHIISLIIINTIKLLGIRETWNHNVLCFLLEGTNPFLNMRQLTFDYPELKKINKKVILYTYALFRVFLMPIFFTLFLYTQSKEGNIPNEYIVTLGVSFVTIYAVSLSWFKKIIDMNNRI